MWKLFITGVISAGIAIAATYADFILVKHDWKELNSLSFGIVIGTALFFLVLLISGQYDRDEYEGGGGADSGM